MKKYKWAILRMSPEGHITPYNMYLTQELMEKTLEDLSDRELMNTKGWLYIGVQICKIEKTFEI